MNITHYLRIIRSISVLSIVVLFVGCGGGGGGGGGSSSAAASVNVSGSWSGTWTNTTNQSNGDISFASLIQTGSTVAGQVSITGSSCASSGNLTGTVSSDNFTGSITFENQTITFNGTIITNQLNGTFTIVSGTAGCNTGSGTISLTLQGGVPAAPTDVTAVPGNGQVTISWTAVSGATSYNIYYSTTLGLLNVTELAGQTSPYTLTGATNGTTYYFVVTAVNAYGESTASSSVSATPTASDQL